MKKEIKISYCEICGLPKHRCYCVRDICQMNWYGSYLNWQGMCLTSEKKYEK